MTISVSANKVTFLGNGSTTTFPYTFAMPASSDAVLVYTDALGNQSTVAPGAYTLTGVGQPTAGGGPQGGTLTYAPGSAPIAAGTSLTLMRMVPVTQPNVFANQSGLWPSVVEGSDDNLCMIVQQVYELASRALLFNIADTVTPTTLPVAAARANRFLGFDGNGNPACNVLGSFASVLATTLTGLDITHPIVISTADTVLSALGRLQAQLFFVAPEASPAFIGIPTGPTAAASTNTNQLATTAFVQAQLAPEASLVSPAFTGIPTAPTAPAGTNTTQLATTAFVQAQTYRRAVTGAVTRTIAAKLGEAFSVLDFAGVDPTGATDSTAGFNAALASMGVGALICPAGTYAVSGQINIAQGQFIRGAGPGATVFSVTSATSDIFVFSPGVAGVNAGISGFSMSSTVTRTAGRYIYDPTVLNTHIHDFYLYGAFVGIELADVVAFVDHGTIYNSVPGTGIGIKISGGGDHYIDHILMDNPAGQPQAGILVTASGGDWITNCDLIRCGIGVWCGPNNGQTVEFMFFSQVACDTCAVEGWLLQTSGTGTIYSVAMENCWGATSSQYGLALAGLGGFIDTVLLTNFRAINNSLHGIFIETAVKNVRMIGGDVAGNSIGTPNTYDGINVGAGLVDFLFDGVHIGASGPFGDIQRNGINILAGSGDYITITNCAVGTANTAIAMGATGLNVNVVNNPGFRTSNTGEVLLLTSTSSLVVSHGLSATPGTWQITLAPLSSLSVAGLTQIWVSATTSTTFTVTANATATAGLYIGWTARVLGA